MLVQLNTTCKKKNKIKLIGDKDILRLRNGALTGKTIIQDIASVDPDNDEAEI